MKRMPRGALSITGNAVHSEREDGAARKKPGQAAVSSAAPTVLTEGVTAEGRKSAWHPDGIDRGGGASPRPTQPIYTYTSPTPSHATVAAIARLCRKFAAVTLALATRPGRED